VNLPFVKFDLGRKRIHGAAATADRGELRFVKGETSVADRMTYGRLNAAGVPEWVDLLQNPIVSFGSPSRVLAAAAGVGATLTFAPGSSSRSGRIVLVAGSSGLAAGLIATITTGETLPDTEYGVTLSSADDDATVPDFFFDFGSRTTTTWQLHSRVALAAGTSYHLIYLLVPFKSFVYTVGVPDPHTHVASDTTSGQFAMSRLASGIPSGSQFVRDDGVLAVPNFAGMPANLNIMLDGGSSVIQTGVMGDIQVPAGFNVVGWDLVADQVGSIVVDVWKDTYGVFPPTAADTITGSEKPTLAGVLKNQDLALTTWTTALVANDWLRFNVDSAATVTRVSCTLRLVRT